MNNWRYSLKVLLTSVLVGISCAVAVAADAPAPPSIYFWNSGGSSNEYVKSPDKWGNGVFRVSREVPFDTLETLRVTTRGLREGVRFDMKKPIDLAPYTTSDGYLRLRVQFHSNQRNSRGGPEGPGMPGIPGGIPGMPGMPGGGRFVPAPLMQPQIQSSAQVLPPIGGAPGPGYNPVPSGPPRETTKIDHLQVTFMLEHGAMSTVIDIPKRRGSEDQVDTRRAHADDYGWILFIVPMKSFHATPGASGNLQRVILTSDDEDTFYLSQLALVVSSDKMSVSIRRQSDPAGTQQGEITVKPGRLTLVADVESGNGDPQVTWNFDADNPNANQPAQAMQPPPDFDPDMPWEGQPQMPAGPPVDARGLVVTHTYPNEEQNYRVEVTVHDRTGHNADVKSSILVRVRNGG